MGDSSVTYCYLWQNGLSEIELVMKFGAVPMFHTREKNKNTTLKFPTNAHTRFSFIDFPVCTDRT
ncbi:hypothetical protein SDC9_97452 [bioreactor metagenome]|uniref:Uncharacterized protein n=1 Tax=bioreactor metagenome TaxID=1076179 RepID=A0A645AC11_9ZZZZ